MKDINDIIDELKMLMNCKCYAMQSNSNTKCSQNCGCDGSCAMFKNFINLIKNN